MHLRSFFLSLSVVALVVLSSCKDKKADDLIVEPVITKVVVRFTPQWQGNPFVMQSVYYDNFGNRLRIDKFMHYVTSLRLIKEDNTEVMLKDFYLLNFLNDNTIEMEVPAGKYKKLKFDVGIPEAYNKDQDPAQYPSSSPLSVAGSQGMFWTWNTGYIFVKFEGMADTTGTEGQELLSPFAIHIGDDPHFRRFTTPTFSTDIVAGETKSFNVILHVDQLLATGGVSDIDLATDAITHTSNNLVLATTFVDNYINAVTVEQ